MNLSRLNRSGFPMILGNMGIRKTIKLFLCRRMETARKKRKNNSNSRVLGCS